MATIKLSTKEIKDIIELFDMVAEEFGCPNDDTLIGGLLEKQQKIYRKFKKALKPIKVSSRKGKGRNLQKMVCQKIADLFGIEYNQQDDNCLIHSREMGQSGTDIILRGWIRDLFAWDIECKNTETINLYKNIEQAKANKEEGRNWLLVHKKNNSAPIAILDLDIFFKILNGEIIED